MALATLMTSIRSLRQSRHDRFELNSLTQIGTADASFRDPLSYAADPAGSAGDMPVTELADRLGISEQLVTELRLVCDGPWNCALRTMLLDACGLTDTE